MLIEVTRKEAMGIYSRRYIEEKGGNKVLLKLLAIVAVALVIAIWIMNTALNDWLGVVAFLILVSPAGYLSLRLHRGAGKYARSQIEEQG